MYPLTTEHPPLGGAASILFVFVLLAMVIIAMPTSGDR